MVFEDRTDAGRALSSALSAYQGRDDLIVLGLPRGGVPVAYEVAKALDAPLDVMIVRKLGVPGREELAMGAVATGGVRILNADVVDALQIPKTVIDHETERQLQVVKQRERTLRHDRPQPTLEDRCVILVDDGLATGATMRAAVIATRQHRPREVVVAVPVASPRTVEALQEQADAVICPETPESFYAVGQFYVNFSQTSDQQVKELLQGAWFGSEQAKPGDAEGVSPASGPVHIPIGRARLTGELDIPADAQGLVVFAHGSGSSRLSPRNRRVAKALQAGRLATLLLDLLTPDEEDLDHVSAKLRFDIDLLAERLVGAIDWAARRPGLDQLRIGLFGASTGAAAALVAAAHRPEAVAAVVSRGGRPDLALDALPEVQAPTLLLVGSRDVPVIDMNRQAASQLTTDHRLDIIPGATHLFEEPGALEQVAQRARDWFSQHLHR